MRLVSFLVSAVLIGLSSADLPLPVSAQPCPIPPSIERADGLPIPPSVRAEGDTCIAGNNGSVALRWSTGLTAGRGIAVVDDMASLDACCGTSYVLPLGLSVCLVWQAGGGERRILAHAEFRDYQAGSGTPPDTCVARPGAMICRGNTYRIALPDPGGTSYYYSWFDLPLDLGCTYVPRTDFYFNVMMCDSGGGDVFRALDNVARGCFDWHTTDGGTTWPELAFGSPASVLLYSEFLCTEPISSFPYCESFDAITFPPAGWYTERIAGTGDPGTWDRVTIGTNPTCAPRSGAAMARYNSDIYFANTRGILVTPPLNLTSDDFYVSFWMYRDTADPSVLDRVNVHYSTTDSLDGATLLGTIYRSTTQSPVVPDPGWYEYQFAFPPGSAGSGRYVILEGWSMRGNNTFIDDVCVEEASGSLGCATPIAPLDGATGVDAGSRTLTWQGVGGAQGYRLFFGTDSPPTDLVNGDDLGPVTGYTYRGLSYPMTYYWQIVPYNAYGEATGCAVWSFTTQNPIASYPHCESFDAATFPPPGWYTERIAGAGNPGTWNRVTSGTNPTCSPHSGVGMARYACNSYPGNTRGLLMTPPLDVPDDTYYVSFWMYRDSGWSDRYDRVNVHYSTTDSLDGATLLGTIHRSTALSPTEPSNGWYQYSFWFPAGSGGSGRYVMLEGWGGSGNNVFIDDVCIDEWTGLPPPPDCTTLIAPTNGATGVFPVHGTLSWSSALRAEGYTLFFGTDGGGTAPPTDIVNGTDLGDVTSYPYSGLSYTTTHYWQVIPYNSSGDAMGCAIWGFETGADPHLYPPFCEEFADGYSPPGWTEGEGYLGDPTTFTGTNSSWNEDGFANSDVTGCARLLISGATMGDWMFTPPIHLGGGGSWMLDFDLALTESGLTTPTSLNEDDRFVVVISTDGGATWYESNALRSWDSTTPISNTGDHITISLAAYSGSIMLGFYGESTVNNGSLEVFVDNVCVYEQQPYEVVVNQLSPDSKTWYGQSHYYLMEIYNRGTNGDSYDLTYVGSWAAGIYDAADSATVVASTALAAGARDTVAIRVDVPSSAAWHETNDDVFTASSALVRATDSDTITTTALQNYGGGGTAEGGYLFANSRATDAPEPWMYPTYDWIDSAGTVSYILDDIDSWDVGGPYPIGFTFTYFDVDYTQFWVSPNGWITLTATTNAAEYNSNMPNNAEPNNLIAWFWREMDPGDTDVPDRNCYYFADTAGNRVITFYHYPEYFAGPQNWITAQLILYNDSEVGNDRIKIQYAEKGAWLDTTSAVAGIENADGTLGIEYHYYNTGCPLFSSPLSLMYGPDNTNVPVELSSLSGVGGFGYADLRWETATEHENLGYYLLRKAAGVEAFVRVNQELVPGAGTTLEPQAYEYRDEGLEAGTYTYKLVDVSFDGVTAEHGPITLVVGDELPLVYAISAKNGDPVEFRLALPVQSPMSLKVYDLAGREVWKLEREDMAAGTYTIAWSGLTAMGSRASSSTYVYRMRCGDAYVQTGKVVLLR